MSYRKFYVLEDDKNRVELREHMHVSGPENDVVTWKWRAYAVENSGVLVDLIPAYDTELHTLAGVLALATAYFAAREQNSTLNLHQNLPYVIEDLGLIKKHEVENHREFYDECDDEDEQCELDEEDDADHPSTIDLRSRRSKQRK